METEPPPSSHPLDRRNQNRRAREAGAVHWILLVNTFATLYMTGLIWFVQVVHYPLFAKVGDAEFPAYSRAHQTLTTLVVGPPMLLEALTAGLMVVARPAGVPAWMAWVGILLVLIIWASTAALQVPAHGKLVHGFDASTNDLLVHSNWIRTVGWTARAVLVMLMLHASLGADASSKV